MEWQDVAPALNRMPGMAFARDALRAANWFREVGFSTVDDLPEVDAVSTDREEWEQAMRDQGVPDVWIGHSLAVVDLGSAVLEPSTPMPELEFGEFGEIGRINVGAMTVTMEVDLPADVESVVMRGYYASEEPLRHLLDWVADYQQLRGWA